METEKQNIIVKQKRIISNKEVLEEIRRLFQEELNTNPECISLYDLSKLLKETREREIDIQEKYENEFDYIITKSENLTGGISTIDFNYSKKELEIRHCTSRHSYKIIFSKKDGDLYIVSSSDKISAQEMLVLLGERISELYDELLVHKEFDHIGHYNPKSVNSNFEIYISSLDIKILSVLEQKGKQIENNFSLTTWHQDGEGVYQYNCNSNNIISEIKGHENEIFKRIFIKIEDCPEWTIPILYEQRKKQLEELDKNKKELQIKEENRQKRLELLRKIFPFLDLNRMTMDQKQIEIANRHLYLEDKLSKLSIMQSENKLTERTLNILFTKLRYEDDDNLSLKDLEYLVNAYLMPFDEINKHIERYDSSLPKLDAVKFVNELVSTYNMDKDKIINRIKEVRNINKLIKLEQNNKTKRLTKGD